MKKLALVGLLLLTSCDPMAGSVPIKDSPAGDVTARFIGTVDGCRLWSVDRGTFYFANCRGSTTSTGFWRRSGKTSHYYAAAADYAE